MSGILVTRTNLAVGGLLAVFDAMPYDHFHALKDMLAAAAEPKVQPEVVPVLHALAAVMDSYEDDQLDRLRGVI